MEFVEEKKFAKSIVIDLWRDLTNLPLNDLRPHIDNILTISLFEGRCGYAQCRIERDIKSRDLQIRPFATQSLDRYWHGHVGLVVKFGDSDHNDWFVVDPTFIQFCRESISHKIQPPGWFLRQSKEGSLILDEILADGYFRLTPLRARLYLSAFCLGDTSLTSAAAMTFLKSPPAHPYHFSCIASDQHIDFNDVKPVSFSTTSKTPRLG